MLLINSGISAVRMMIMINYDEVKTYFLIGIMK